MVGSRPLQSVVFRNVCPVPLNLRFILISVQGEVTAVPDHATLNLGVELRATATVAEARFEQQEARYRLSRNLSTSAAHWSGIKL